MFWSLLSNILVMDRLPRKRPCMLVLRSGCARSRWLRLGHESGLFLADRSLLVWTQASVASAAHRRFSGSVSKVVSKVIKDPVPPPEDLDQSFAGGVDFSTVDRSDGRQEMTMLPSSPVNHRDAAQQQPGLAAQQQPDGEEVGAARLLEDEDAAQGSPVTMT